MNIVLTGASRGIGFELVKLFLQADHQVYCLTRHTEVLAKMEHPNLHPIATDLASEESMEAAAKQILAAVPHVDVLVNNAGSLVNKPFRDIAYTELEYVYRINVFAPFRLTQLLKLAMGQRKEPSHVVNISSMGGFQGSAKFAGLSAYSSSKAAVAGLTECLAEEFKGRNISVNCLALGAVQTEMLKEAFPGYEAPLTSRQMADYIFDFALHGQKYYNGKILPVSLSTP